MVLTASGSRMGLLIPISPLFPALVRTSLKHLTLKHSLGHCLEGEFYRHQKGWVARAVCLCQGPQETEW